MTVTFFPLTAEQAKESAPRLRDFFSGFPAGGKISSDWTATLAAQTRDGDIVAVSFVRRVVVPALNNHVVFECRCMVRHRADIFMSLLFETAKMLERNRGDAVGVMSVYADDIVKGDPSYHRAVWPESGFVFMGYTKSNEAAYVHYFKNVRI